MAIPEKELYSLEEIIARWGSHGCDYATLLGYARHDQLIFSVYLRDLGSHKAEVVTSEGTVTTTSNTLYRYTNPEYEWKPIRYLKPEDARRILEATDGEKIAISVLYSSPKRDRETGMGFTDPHYFTASDLFITHAERAKFETIHKVNFDHGLIKGTWLWLGDANNHKPLAMLGTMIAAIAFSAWQVFVWWSGNVGGSS